MKFKTITKSTYVRGVPGPISWRVFCDIDGFTIEANTKDKAPSKTARVWTVHKLSDPKYPLRFGFTRDEAVAFVREQAGL